MIKQKLKEAEEYPYLGWFREQLQITKTKVHKWSEWKDDSVYEAFIESRRVHVPVPVNDWSFLVALHEIGHISTGDRLYSYLSEYNSEQWAIRRAKKAYNVVCKDYEKDAKQYVLKHLIADLTDTELQLSKVKPYVKKWIGLSDRQIAKQVLKYHKRKQLGSPINVKYWKSIADGKNTNTRTRNKRKSFKHHRILQFAVQSAKRTSSNVCSYIARWCSFFSRSL
jgi:hypothetical protein